MEFQRLERELEHMINLFQAWQYYATQKATVNAKNAFEQGQSKINKIQDKIANHKETIQEIDNEIEQIALQSKSVSKPV